MTAVIAIAAIFGAAVLISAAVSVSAWLRRHEATGYLSIAVLAAGSAWWSATSVVTVIWRDPTATLWAISLTYPGVFLLVGGWWVTSKALADRFWRLRPRSALLLVIEPVLCMITLATNPWHHLFIDHLKPTSIGGAYAAVFGPLFWVHAVYCYALLTLSGLRVFRLFVRGAGRKRGYLLAVLATLPAAVVNLASRLSGGTLVDLTAIGLAAGAPVMYWLVRHDSAPSAALVSHHDLFRIMSDLVIVVDGERRILENNPAAERLLGRVERLPDVFGELPADGHSEFTIDDCAGTGTDLSVQISAVTGRRTSHTAWVLVARDVTEDNNRRRALENANARLHTQLATIERLRADLAEQAARDHLTGLHNRRHLMTALEELSGSGRRFGFVLLDIDHFKQINDRYGHTTGDDVLVQVARLLSGVARPGDLVARYGGEEFAIVLADCGRDEAAARIDEVRRAIRDGDNGGVPVTVSAGVADSTGSAGLRELVHAADMALYAAKEAGRDQVRVDGLSTQPVPAGGPVR